MPADRARGVGLFGKVRARTIRVLMTAKLFEKLILQALSLLGLPSVKAFAGTCARSAGTQIGEIKKKIYRSIFEKKFEKKIGIGF